MQKLIFSRWALGGIILCLGLVLHANDVVIALENNLFAVGLTGCLRELLLTEQVVESADSLVRRIQQSGDLFLDAASLPIVTAQINPYLRGVRGICAGQPREAQQALANSEEMGYKLDLSHLLLGDLAASQGDLARAADDWAASEAGSVFLARARTALAAKDLENASLYLSILQRLLDRLDPWQVRDLANLHQALGDHHLEEKTYPEAASAYQAVLQYAPGRHYVRVRLAKMYRDQLDQLDEAIQELERTIELGDERWQAIAYGELGYTYFLMGQTERAFSALQHSIKMDQDVAMPHFYLGKLLQQEDQLELACDEYCTALALNPDAQWIENVYTQFCVSPQ